MKKKSLPSVLFALFRNAKATGGLLVKDGENAYNNGVDDSISALGSICHLFEYWSCSIELML